MSTRAVDLTEQYANPTTAPAMLAHLQDTDHALQGSGMGGFSYVELAQIHLGEHLKTTPDHMHPDLDLSATTKFASTNDLYRAIYPGAEVREDGLGAPRMVGHFARFNEWTEIDSLAEGQFMERIAPGAFADSFTRITPKALFQHGRDPEIGDKVLGSPVTVREDEQGAAYEVPLFPSVPQLLLDGLRAGAYGASFRFHVNAEDAVRKPGRSDHNPDGLPERTILSADVAEFGPVTFPAYAGATAGIRSLTDQFRPRDLDREIAQMAVERPDSLAKVIQRALKPYPATEEKPREEKPPATQRFRTREEYLEWMSTI